MSAERKLEDWEVTGLIYKVANELQGIKKPDEEAQNIIDRIGKMRQQGKLNQQQLNILDGMQFFRIDGSDEF